MVAAGDACSHRGRFRVRVSDCRISANYVAFGLFDQPPLLIRSLSPTMKLAQTLRHETPMRPSGCIPPGAVGGLVLGAFRLA